MQSDSFENDQQLLDDTQKLDILPDDLDYLFSKVFEDIHSRKINIALKGLEKLIRENYRLNELATQLEDFCRQNPEEIDLWLILVRIFKKIGENEKILDALESAQRNLSLK